MAYVIRAGGLVDARLGELLPDPWVVIEGATVREVGTGTPPPAGMPCYDYSDAVLMAGLIDSHVHLVLPGNGTPGEATLHEDDSTLFARAAGNALNALSAGVTTLRDCGGRGTLTIELRDAVNKGLMPGPRIVAAGPPLTHTGGHCHYFGGEVDGPLEVAKKARELFKAGADYIKMMGTGGGTPGTIASRAYFSTEELAAAVDTARRLGKTVGVHVLCTEAASRALQAGVDRIEHGQFLTDDDGYVVDREAIQQIATAGIPITGTLGVFRYALEKVGHQVPPEERELYERLLEASIVTAQAYIEAGVPILMGTDGGWRHTPFDDPYIELKCMTEAGMTNAQALLGATELAAQALGLESELGRVEAGFAADLVLLDDNPLENLEAVRTARAVVKSGRLWREPAHLRSFVGAVGAPLRNSVEGGADPQ